MQLTNSQLRLISDAQSFGYTLTIERTCFRLVKKNKKKIVSGIVFWEDGTIYRLDIPSELSINLSSKDKKLIDHDHCPSCGCGIFIEQGAKLIDKICQKCLLSTP
jgi:hypothetical protein